jgi:hypothetical protein
MAYERPAAPIHADITEHPMLDLVPFAGSMREAADRDAQARLVGEGLDGNLA